MATSKNRFMSLTAAMARFTDVAAILRSRAEVDETLRDLCEDYHLARQILSKTKKERPRQTKKVAEYTSLVEDLENEIILYLLGVEEEVKRE